MTKTFFYIGRIKSKNNTSGVLRTEKYHGKECVDYDGFHYVLTTEDRAKQFWGIFDFENEVGKVMTVEDAIELSDFCDFSDLKNNQYTNTAWYGRSSKSGQAVKGTKMKHISLDNGLNYLTASEAVKDEHWCGMAPLAELMEDEIRERVHDELAPCTDEEFLDRYLELANHDLIIG